jgi:hypothetical protein
LAVFVHLSRPRPDGLPDAEEGAQLNAAEDHLVELLGDNALRLGRLTMAARRETHFYVRDPESAERVIADWRARADAWGVNHMLQADPGWTFAEEGFYRPLAPGQAKD